MFLFKIFVVSAFSLSLWSLLVSFLKVWGKGQRCFFPCELVKVHLLKRPILPSIKLPWSLIENQYVSIYFRTHPRPPTPARARRLPAPRQGRSLPAGTASGPPAGGWQHFFFLMPSNSIFTKSIPCLVLKWLATQERVYFLYKEKPKLVPYV